MLRVDTACGGSGATSTACGGAAAAGGGASPWVGQRYMSTGERRAAGTRAAAGLCISVVAGASEAASEAAGAAFNLGFRSAGDSQNVI